jgi:hypothetical protein
MNNYYKNYVLKQAINLFCSIFLYVYLYGLTSFGMLLENLIQLD